MKRVSVLGVFVLVLAACGGEDGGASADQPPSNGGDSSSADEESGVAEGGSGDVVNPQPPGQASASVDGESYTFDTVGPIGCDIGGSEFNAGFLIGNNEVSFVGGGNASGSEWQGRIDLNIQGSEGVTNYFADFSGGDGGAVAVDGASMSYSGEWQVFLPGASEPESVGNGTLSFTCG